MKLKKKTLSLAKETLRQLSESRLAAAEGGRPPVDSALCTELNQCWTAQAGCM